MGVLRIVVLGLGRAGRQTTQQARTAHLIMHCPCPIDERHLPARHHALHGVQLVLRRVLHPALEKGLLDVGEGAVGVVEEVREDRVNGETSVGMLDGVISTSCVLVHGFEPPHAARVGTEGGRGEGVGARGKGS